MRKKFRVFFIIVFMITFSFSSRVSAGSVDDSGNVKYGDFVSVHNIQNDTTILETGLLEYVVTFPYDTDIVPYSTKFYRLGDVTVEGKAFIKPYKIALNVYKEDFKLFSREKAEGKSDTIEFDVTRAVQNASGALVNGESVLDKTIYYYKNDSAGTTEERQAYQKGELADILQSVSVGITIEDSQWENASPGEYKGKITFVAKIDNTNIF